MPNEDDLAMSFSPVPPDLAVTLCIVEDHDELRAQLGQFLERSGHLVVASVGTMRSGYRAILDHRPEVAIIEHNLPDGTGIDLCRTISPQVPDVALLLHTAAVEHGLEDRALEAGARALVPKSMRGLTLLEAIAQHARPFGHR